MNNEKGIVDKIIDFIKTRKTTITLFLNAFIYLYLQKEEFVHAYELLQLLQFAALVEFLYVLAKIMKRFIEILIVDMPF